MKYVLRWGCILLVLLVGFAASEEMFLRLKPRVAVEEAEEPLPKVKISKRLRIPASTTEQDFEESVPLEPQVSRAETSYFPEEEPTPKTEKEDEVKEEKEEVVTGSFASAPVSRSASLPARAISSSGSKGGSKAAAFAQTITNTAFRGVLGSSPTAPRILTPVTPPTSGSGASATPTTPTVTLPSLTIADVTVTEGGLATFTVSLSQVPTSTVSFNWATSDQTALSGTDYTSGSNSVVIVPPATSATFTVNTSADVLACEGDKLFNVNLSGVTGATATDTLAIATIEEDDLPLVSFTAATSSGSEAGAISVGVTLSSACVGQTLTYQIDTTDGTALSSGAGQDFTALTSQSFTIPSGSLTGTFSFTPINDTRDEDDQDLTFTISSLEMGLGAQTTHVLTLTDNDAPPTIALSSLVTVAEGNGTGTTNAVMSASLSVASEKTVTIDFATSDASSGFIATTASGDYDAGTGTLTFAPFDTAESLAVVINRDDLDENNERLNVTLSGGSLYTVAGSTLSSQIEITNDDSSPSISIGTPVTIGEGGTSATFTITLSGVSGRTVGFDLATTNSTATSGSDYTALSTSYTIAAGSTTRTVTVPITDDALGCEGDETFTTTLSNLSNASAGTLTSTATITENDFPVVSIASATVNEGASASLTASLSFLCATPVSFDWTSVPNTAQMTTDFPVTSGSVTINAGSLTSAAFTVPTTQDTLPEVQESFFVTATNINGASSSLGSVGIVTVNDTDPGVSVTKVSVGLNSSCALSSGGEVKCWGANHYGKLGKPQTHLGDQAGEMGNSLPALNLGDDSGVPHTVLKIVRASYHACALFSNQRVKCWGHGLWWGRLGLANSDEDMGDHPNELGNNLPFVDLGTDGSGNPWQVVDIGVGDLNSCALMINGRVKCWGAGRMTGTNDYVGRYNGMGNALPFLDLGGTNQVLQLSVGFRHACVLMEDGVGPAGDGDVKCWGGNLNGALGNNSLIDTPIAPGGFGSNLLPVNFGTGLKALSVVAGNQTTCAIIEENPATPGGFVKCWGYNGGGILGLSSYETRGNGYIDSAPGIPVDEMGDNLPYTILGAGQRATEIFLGGVSSACAILDDDGDTTNGGNLKCWGNNSSHQTGNSVGNLWDHEGDETGEMEALGFVNLGTGLKAFSVSHSNDSTCVLVDSDNNVANGRGVKCWGRTYRGAVGDPHVAEADGVLGNGGQMGDLLPFVDLGTGNVVDLSVGVTAINAGYFARNNHCAIMSDGRAKCWGDDGAYQLLQGKSYTGDAPGEMGASLPVVDLGTGVKAIDIAVGTSHACVLTDSHEVKCWGAASHVGLGNAGWTGYEVGDDVGEMGNNLQSINFGAGRTVLALNIGYGANCVLLDNFETKCWGSSGYWMTGYSGDTPSPASGFNFGTGRYALQIDQGHDVGCALLDNLQIKCWGRNNLGQLLLDLTTSMYGTNSSQDGDDLPYMNIGSGLSFTKVSVNSNAICALATNGQLKCWGSNSYGATASGQNGSGSYGTNLGDIAAERGAGLPSVNFNGASVIDFSFHGNGCAIVGVSRELKCWGPHGWVKWGFNGLGATLGAGDGYGDALTEVGASFASVPIGIGRQVVQVSKGLEGADTCVILDDNSVKCFGYNSHGQSGIGHRNRIGDDDGEVAALTGIDLGF